jgi:hypothetical protein
LKLSITILRWIARFIGIFLFLFFIWFAFHYGSPNINSLSNQEIKLFLSNILMLLGLLVVWKFEFIGGFLLILGYVFFAIANYSVWNGPVFPTFFFLGVLHLLCWSLSVFTKNSSHKISLLMFLK